MSGANPLSIDDHVCFGCQTEIGDGAHIHVGFNELERFDPKLTPIEGMEWLSFTFCEACTKKSKHGWQLERHTEPTR